MTQPSLPWDICAGRHRGNPESREANPAPSCKRAAHERILGLLQHGPMTSRQIAALTGWPMNTFSGRLTELLLAGRIERTGERRDGCAVLMVRGL